MELYLQAAGGALIAVVLCLTLGKHGKETGTVLSVMVCCMICIAAVQYLQPVMDFINQLESVGVLDHDFITIILKATGIGLLSEIASLVCSDAGNSALGKSLQLLGNGVILWLSIPLFQAMLELLQEILGDV